MRKILISAITSLFMLSTSFAADVDGTWNISLMAPEGGAQDELIVTTDGEIANAKLGPEDLTGTYINGVLKLKGTVFSPEAGMSAELDMTANIDGDIISGTATWDMYDLSVNGTRK